MLGEGTNSEDVVLAFAPGEVTTLWAQGLRYRADIEKGVPRTVVLGYSMDHEGYLLTTDDWLRAGYEPAITWWGPLHGEHLLERHLDVVKLAHSPVAEDPTWPDYPTSTWYPDWKHPSVVPDATPTAGVALDAVPAYLFTRDGVPTDTVQPAAQVARVSGIARFTFEGADPAMGMTTVVIEDVWEDDFNQTADIEMQIDTASQGVFISNEELVNTFTLTLTCLSVDYWISEVDCSNLKMTTMETEI